MERKEKAKTYSFRASTDLIQRVQNKIDKENLKAKDRESRTNLSRKLKELLYDYVSR